MKVETIKRFVRDWDREIFVNKYVLISKEPIKQNRSIIKVFVYSEEEVIRLLFQNYEDDILKEDEQREKEIRNQLEILDDEFLLKCLEYCFQNYDSSKRSIIQTLAFEYCKINKKDYDTFYDLTYYNDSLDEIIIDI